MSVINQMLRDLEDRKQPKENVEQPVFSAPVPSPWPARLVLLIVIIVVAAAIWWFGFAHSPSTQPKAAPQTPAEPSVVAKQAVVPAANKPADELTQKTSPPIAGAKNQPPQQQTDSPQAQVTAKKPALESAETKQPPAQQRAAETTPEAEAIVTKSAQTPAAPTATKAPETTPKSEVSPPADVVSNKPNQAPASSGKAKVKLSAMTAAQSAELQLNEARGYAANGRLKDSENAYRTVLTRNPKLTNARLEMVALLTQQRQEAKALQLVDEGLRYLPTDAQLTTVKAQLLLTIGRTEEAWDALQPLNESQVQEMGFFIIKAGLASQRSEFEVAYRNYSRLTIKDPAQGRWWLGKAISAEQMGNNAEAVEGYRRALTSSGLSAGSMQYAQHRLDMLGTQSHGKN
ncbi:tetratricopeptide repeat protein [Neiella marina]|uniref:Tetratricopeptide repeat protein n=1 Tax=Neiella holothuriorum TaxID=2870530 RepID=A0ABS7EAS9_9GAMM|nr:tetratricopeptide repeat protein [Neiella holothuriorum]MBW8189439.1 tetratricopeptide repeat protein [Neiella holothuriorum]